MSQQSNPKLVAFSVLFYMFTAIIMVLANKSVLNSVPDLPIFFLWLQIIVAVVLLHTAKLMNWIKLPKLEIGVVRQLIPLITINVIGLTMNTLCLKYVDASIFQVARGLVLPFTVLFSFVFLKQASSFKVILACGLVCLGFVSGMILPAAATPTNVTLLGIFYGFLSSVTTAIHAIIIKKSHNIVKSTLDLAYYNNLLSSIGLLPLVWMNGEFGIAYNTFFDLSATLGASADEAEPVENHIQSFLVGLIITGFFGFMINIAGFLQIKVTSPVTHMISSAVRGVLQTLLALFLFSEPLTQARVLGILFILSGSTMYTYFRAQENLQKSLENSSLPIYVKNNHGYTRVGGHNNVRTDQNLMESDNTSLAVAAEGGKDRVFGRGN